MFISFNLSSLIFFSPLHISWPLKYFEQKIPVNSLITSEKCKDYKWVKIIIHFWLQRLMHQSSSDLVPFRSREEESLLICMGCVLSLLFLSFKSDKMFLLTIWSPTDSGIHQCQNTPRSLVNTLCKRVKSISVQFIRLY